MQEPAGWASANDPQVVLEFGFMFCDRHLLPFKAEWPKGAGLVMVGLFNAAVLNEDIAHHAEGNVRKLTPVLREFGPVCCFVGETVMEQVTEAALAGRVWHAE